MIFRFIARFGLWILCVGLGGAMLVVLGGDRGSSIPDTPRDFLLGLGLALVIAGLCGMIWQADRRSRSGRGSAHGYEPRDGDLWGFTGKKKKKSDGDGDDRSDGDSSGGGDGGGGGD